MVDSGEVYIQRRVVAQGRILGVHQQCMESQLMSVSPCAQTVLCRHKLLTCCLVLMLLTTLYFTAVWCSATVCWGLRHTVNYTVYSGIGDEVISFYWWDKTQQDDVQQWVLIIIIITIRHAPSVHSSACCQLSPQQLIQRQFDSILQG